jgi:transposase-like protein
MGKPNFSDEFKRDAVAQITERGYPVAEVSEHRDQFRVRTMCRCLRIQPRLRTH